MFTFQKHILYSVLTSLTFLCAFSQPSHSFCCGGKKEEEDEKKPLKSTLNIQQKNPVYHDQPQAEPLLVGRTASAHATSFSNFVDPTPSSSTNTSFLSGAFASAAGKFTEFDGDIIAYLKTYKSSLDDGMKIEASENKWALRYRTDELIVIYLETLAHPLLQGCLGTRINPKQDSFIFPSLKAYLDKNHPELSQMLVGAFYNAYQHSKGKMYCIKGSKGNVEVLFESSDKKTVPSPYVATLLLTGSRDSSNHVAKSAYFLGL